MAKKKVFQISNALTEGLEETISAAHNYSGDLRIDVIPIKRIDVDPENPRDMALTIQDVFEGIDPADPLYLRKTDELADLQSIANSIRDQGIINPIVVYKYGERYRLIAGERRTLASIVAGKHDIQAKILDTKPAELKVSLLQWIENVERSDLSLWERLRNLEKILNIYAYKKNISAEEITITEISQLIGCSKPHAINYKAALFSSSDIKELIHSNRIRNLEKAALIAGITSPELQQQAVNACLAGSSLKKLKLFTETKRKLKVTSNIRPLRRGRQASQVNFGATKNIEVAKVVMTSLSSHKALASHVDYISKVDWQDHQSISDTFKKVLQKLEEMYS